MTALHRVAEVTRKIGIGFGIGILSIIFFVLAIRLFLNIKESLYPTPPAPPTVGYGKLPAIIFPEATISTLPKVTLSTVSGILPQLGNTVNVYKFLQNQISFSSLADAKAIAAKNNFVNDPESLSDLVYQWKSSSFLNQTLTMNILTYDFSLSSDYLQNATVIAGNAVGDPPGAIDATKSFFEGFLPSFPNDIDDTKTQTSLLTIDNDSLVKSTSLANANIIRVDLYQNDVNQLPLYYPHYPQSLMEGFIGSGDSAPEVVAATYTHRDIDESSHETYPIKTAQQALEELKKGNGYIANYDTPTQPVTIRNVSLGYYIGDNPAQQFLMPIIVFQGDNNFYAFVSAITDSWIQK